MSQIGGITDIRWVMPAVNGAGATLSGPRIATLAVQPGTIGSFVASMPNLVVTIDTQYGAAWTQYWTTTLQTAGLTYGTQFTVQSTSSTATLTVFGQQSASGSAVDDIVLTFQSSTLNVVPRAGT